MNTVNKEGQVDIKGIREWYSFSQQEVAKAIKKSNAVFSLQERHKRKTRPETMERLFYDVHHACKKMQKQLIEWSHDLDKNTYQQPEDKEFNSLEEEIEDECNMELYYQPITEELFMDAVLRVEKGHSIERIALELEINEDDLAKRLIEVGIPYETVSVDDEGNLVSKVRRR